MSSPRAIGSTKPYRNKAKWYVKYGWTNPIPLPPNKKNPPPTGFTGHAGKDVDEQQIERWLQDLDEESINYSTERANIALRLNVVVREEVNPKTGDLEDVYYELIGIDVDHHPDDPEDPKHGGPQLDYLEKKLGKLPDTWISSARTNGIAGIRFFLWPVEVENGKPQLLAWRGDCGEAGAPDIDIISRGYRFAAVYPSYHPNGGQYLWYPPGVNPAGPKALENIDWTKYGYVQRVSEDGLADTNVKGNNDVNRDLCRIPWTSKLAVLPEKWARWLTRDFLPDPGASPIDMDISDKGLDEWCDSNFGVPRGMCEAMSKTLAAQLVKIENSDTSHNVLYKGHMNLIKLGSKNGHNGWREACEEFEKAWLADVLGRNKRSVRKAESEVMRSFRGALRKVKGRFDEKEFEFPGYDPCDVRIIDEDADGVVKTIDVPTHATDEVSQYRRNDDGNAKHFLHLYRGCLRYVVNVVGQWMIWDGERWHIDDRGYARHLFRAVQDRQIAAGQQMVAEGVRDSSEERKKAGAALVQWGLRSGMAAAVSNALEQAQSFPGISVKFEELDADPMMLGLANGVIRFNTKSFRESLIRQGKPDVPFEFLKSSRDKSLLITMNTGVPYIATADQMNMWKIYKRYLKFIDSGGTREVFIADEISRNTKGQLSVEQIEQWLEIGEGYDLFAHYMKTFLRNHVSDETWEYLPKLFGQMILGNNDEKIAPFLYGETATGKSTFQKLLVASLGDYADWRDARIFMRKELNPLLASALPKRIICIGEMGKNQMHSELFKNITGNEPVTCELKGKNTGVTMKARCTIVSGCNSPPVMPDEDKAARGRFITIPFRHQVLKEDDDPRAGDELQQKCRIAMLAWLIEGCAEAIMAGGIKPFPTEIEMETHEFTNQLSDIAAFVDERLVVAPEHLWKEYALSTDEIRENKTLWRETEWCISNKELFKHFDTWQKANVNPKDHLRQPSFVRRMADRGFKRDGKKRFEGMTSTDTVWVGFKLQHSMVKTEK